MTPNEIRLIDLSAEESTAGVKPCAVVSNDSSEYKRVEWQESASFNRE